MEILELGKSNRIELSLTTTVIYPSFLFVFTSHIDCNFQRVVLVRSLDDDCETFTFDIVDAGKGTADPVNGRVKLEFIGSWEVDIYAQSSTTNLDPSLSDELLLSDQVYITKDCQDNDCNTVLPDRPNKQTIYEDKSFINIIDMYAKKDATFLTNDNLVTLNDVEDGCKIPKDLTGFTADMQVRDESGVLILGLTTSDSSITFIGDDNNQILLFKSAANMAIAVGCYSYDFELTDTSVTPNVKIPLFKGEFIVSENQVQ